MGRRDDTGATDAEHTPLPTEVRGLYWTAVTATTARADELLVYMLETGINTAVIDVKMDNGELVEVGEFEEILETLYDAGIYRIARIAVMRDSAFASPSKSRIGVPPSLLAELWRAGRSG